MCVDSVWKEAAGSSQSLTAVRLRGFPACAPQTLQHGLSSWKHQGCGVMKRGSVAVGLGSDDGAAALAGGAQ